MIRDYPAHSSRFNRAYDRVEFDGHSRGNPMSNRQSGPRENQSDNLTDAPASQPEVPKRWKEDVNSDEKPSQAEGERGTGESGSGQQGYENKD